MALSVGVIELTVIVRRGVWRGLGLLVESAGREVWDCAGRREVQRDRVDGRRGA
jgi:hypothetical protein